MLRTKFAPFWSRAPWIGLPWRWRRGRCRRPLLPRLHDPAVDDRRRRARSASIRVRSCRRARGSAGLDRHLHEPLGHGAPDPGRERRLGRPRQGAPARGEHLGPVRPARGLCLQLRAPPGDDRRGHRRRLRAAAAASTASRTGRRWEGRRPGREPVLGLAGLARRAGGGADAAPPNGSVGAAASLGRTPARYSGPCWVPPGWAVRRPRLDTASPSRGQRRRGPGRPAGRAGSDGARVA